MYELTTGDHRFCWMMQIAGIVSRNKAMRAFQRQDWRKIAKWRHWWKAHGYRVHCNTCGAWITPTRDNMCAECIHIETMAYSYGG